MASVDLPLRFGAVAALCPAPGAATRFATQVHDAIAALLKAPKAPWSRLWRRRAASRSLHHVVLWKESRAGLQNPGRGGAQGQTGDGRRTGGAARLRPAVNSQTLPVFWACARLSEPHGQGARKAFWISRGYRALGILEEDTITGFWVGSHDDCQRFFS